MKKIILLALCLVIMTASAFAQDKAIGGGIMYNNTTTMGTLSFEYGNEKYDYQWEMNRNGFGAFVFFGLGRFLELNLGVLYKNPSKTTVTYEGNSISGDAGVEGTAALQLGAYFKYPIPINDTLVFFPTGGADFELSLSDEEWDGWKWWHDLWLRAGVGLDIFVSEKVFLRGHALYGVAIPVGGAEDLGLKIGHGLLVKFGVGFMF